MVKVEVFFVVFLSLLLYLVVAKSNETIQEKMEKLKNNQTEKTSRNFKSYKVNLSKQNYNSISNFLKAASI